MNKFIESVLIARGAELIDLIDLAEQEHDDVEIDALNDEYDRIQAALVNSMEQLSKAVKNEDLELFNKAGASHFGNLWDDVKFLYVVNCSPELLALASE